MVKQTNSTLIEFGQWVKKWREAGDLTQEALGRTVGVTKQYISNIENAASSSYTGRPSRPDIEIVDHLARVFKRPLMEARRLAGYGFPVGHIETVEDALDATSFFEHKGLSSQDRNIVRPLLQSADRMIELLSERSRIISEEDAVKEILDPEQVPEITNNG